MRCCFEDPLDAEIFRARFEPKIERFKLARASAMSYFWKWKRSRPVGAKTWAGNGPSEWRSAPTNRMIGRLPGNLPWRPAGAAMRLG